jgi:hypothetical protein
MEPMVLIYHMKHFFCAVVKKFDGVKSIAWPPLVNNPGYGSSQRWLEALNAKLPDNEKIKFLELKGGMHLGKYLKRRTYAGCR